MAGSYNKVLLLGNLTRDPEIRYTTGNQAVANIGLAVNRRYRTQDGQTKEEVTFIDCEAWGRTAETLGQYLKKGRPVFIEGRLKLDQWQDKEGNNRSKLKVVIDGFQFVDSREGGNSGGGGQGGGGERSNYARSGGGGGGGGGRAAYTPPDDGFDAPPDDEIPF